MNFLRPQQLPPVLGHRFLSRRMVRLRCGVIFLCRGAHFFSRGVHFFCQGVRPLRRKFPHPRRKFHFLCRGARPFCQVLPPPCWPGCAPWRGGWFFRPKGCNPQEKGRSPALKKVRPLSWEDRPTAQKIHPLTKGARPSAQEFHPFSKGLARFSRKSPIFGQKTLFLPGLSRWQTIQVGRVTPCAPPTVNPRLRRAEDCPPYLPV